MKLVDLDAKEPYVLDGRYVVNVMSLKPHVHFDYDAIREEIEKKMTHGHWEDVKVSDDGKLQSAKCSVCGRYETKPYTYYLKLSNYCPWCGAKMDVSDTNVGKTEEE